MVKGEFLSRQEQCLGKKIAKKYGEEIHRGTVTKYLPPENSDDIHIWHIIYDNGDEGKLDFDELYKAMLLHESQSPLDSGFNSRQTVGSNPQQQLIRKV